MDYITFESVYWKKSRSKANCSVRQLYLYFRRNNLYFSSFYLIILGFLVVAVGIVFYYSAVRVVINGSGSVTLDSFP